MSEELPGKTVETELVVEGRKVRVRAHVEPELPDWEAPELAGKPLPRVDALDKVTGRARYTSDVQLPGMLHAGILRSPHPHARIVDINVASALGLPGVVAVLTHQSSRGVRVGEQELFATHVKHVGEEVAAVAAVDADTVEEALGLIRVRYELLPHVLDPRDAMRPGAPHLQPGHNVVGGGFGPEEPGKPDEYRRGDAEAALAGADLVVDQDYTTEATQHACMETHGTVAVWDAEGLTVWESTQGVFFVRATLCESLGLPSSRVRVLCPHMGGGFGSKTAGEKHTVIAALLARDTGRPVRLVLGRQEDFEAAFYRPPSEQRLRLGMSREGRIEAIALEAVNAVGAHRTGHYFGECVGPAREFYPCPNVHTVNYAVFTNSPPPSAFRAPGHVPGAWALELAVDEACHELGLDPVEVRLRNLVDRDADTQRPFASNGLEACIRRGAEAIRWRRWRPAGKRKPAGPVATGLGMALCTWGAGGGPPASAEVVVEDDGSVTVVFGACDLGTGTRTVMTQIVAEELRIDPGRIAIASADTRVTPYCFPSFGSLTVASTGPAVRLAAADAKRRLLEAASPMIEVPADKLTIIGGVVMRAEGRGSTIAVAKVAAALPARRIVGHGERGPNPDDSVLTSFAAHFAEVAVDLRMGTVEVLRYVAAHDSGRIMNPATWSSQIHGGILQGLGFALSERRVRDRGGAQLNASLLEYKVPTLADAPGSIEVIDVNVPYPANNIGAKGSGEPPIIPVAPAIANAVFNASGLRIRRAPITPARILEALRAAGGTVPRRTAR